MKKSHIIAIIIVAVGIGIITSFMANASTYGNFTEAFDNLEKKYTIVGHLNREMPVTSQPNQTEFYMTDKEGVERKVILNQTKPREFDQSESLVLTGHAADDGVFYAHDILLKCPSKYNDKSTISE
ncbi:MAG: cytochrome c maturation protein CcmE [Flavobacteriales bacterium]